MNPDLSVALLDDPVDGRQPEPGAPARSLGREERLENMVSRLLVDAGSGVGAAEGGGGCEGSVSCGFADGLSTAVVSGSGLFNGCLVADEAADVVECGGVGDTGEDYLRTVVVDDRLREGAVAGLDLGEVLPDGD